MFLYTSSNTTQHRIVYNSHRSRSYHNLSYHSLTCLGSSVCPSIHLSELFKDIFAPMILHKHMSQTNTYSPIQWWQRPQVWTLRQQICYPFIHCLHKHIQSVHIFYLYTSETPKNVTETQVFEMVILLLENGKTHKKQNVKVLRVFWRDLWNIGMKRKISFEKRQWLEREWTVFIETVQWL